MTKEKLQHRLDIAMYGICAILAGLMIWFIISIINEIKLNTVYMRKAPIEEFIRMDGLSTDFAHPDTVYVYKDTTTNIIHISKQGTR